jgi:LysM repeat protein
MKTHLRYFIILLGLLACFVLVRQKLAQQIASQHIVRIGENLQRIAQTYQLSVETLQAYNALSSDVVFRGQTLRLPPADLQLRLPSNPHPTLADFWAGTAEFVRELAQTGLPMGESDSFRLPSGEIVSYYHASERSAGVRDSCGEPVPFPGCVVQVQSTDGGYTFSQPHTCQFACRTCPCTSWGDQIDQQQYPRIATDGQAWAMVYEYRGGTMLRQSPDGIQWGKAQLLPNSGMWNADYRPCPPIFSMNSHPLLDEADCLMGGPPGVWVEGGMVYLLVGFGSNPGQMGCWKLAAGADISLATRCSHSPLFVGSPTYGDLAVQGASANPYFDFRHITSAEVSKVGEHYYLLYEGTRGPEVGQSGIDPFGLGLARSVGSEIDGRWEVFTGNPILVNHPGNIGLGHADLLVLDGITYLYTSLDGRARQRLQLVWKHAP